MLGTISWLGVLKAFDIDRVCDCVSALSNKKEAGLQLCMVTTGYYYVASASHIHTKMDMVKTFMFGYVDVIN